MNAKPKEDIALISFRGSELERLELCPGSKLAADKIAGKETLDATSGTAIHNALSEVVTLDSVLNKDAMAAAVDTFVDANGWDKAEHARKASILRWFAGIVQGVIQSRGGALDLVKESKQFLSFTGNGGEFVEVSGTPDLIARCADGVEVFEYKTGEGEQETAEAHLQGQLYNLLAAKMFPPVMVNKPYNVRLHIIAAGNEKGENHTFTDYDEKALKACYVRIVNVVNAALAVNPPRNTSLKACRWCRAAGTSRCPESTGALDKFAANVQKMDNPTAIFGALAPEARAAVIDRIKFVKPIIDKILDAAKEGLAANPDFIPGYGISKPTKTKKIEDTAGAFNVVRGAGISGEEFASACSVSLPELKALYASKVRGEYIKRSEKPPAKTGLDVQLVEMLTAAGVIVETEKAGSLEKLERPPVY